MYQKIIHYGDAGRAKLLCGTKEKKRNWSFRPEAVTCSRCLRSLAKRKTERAE